MSTRSSEKSLSAQASEVLSRSKQPIYLQLVAEFRRNIASGVWVPGKQIPSLENLMEQYQVARMTIRNALGVLESEGYIRRGRGIGTFVQAKIPHVQELKLPTSWAETVALSDVLGTQSIFESEQTITALPELGMDFSGSYAAEYVHLCRVHVKDDVPYCYSEVYLSSELFNGHKADFRKSAAASVMARIPGLTLSAARQKINIGGAGFLSARSLNLNVGDSVAEVRRYACAQDQLIYFARLEFPTQFVKLEFDLLAH